MKTKTYIAGLVCVVISTIAQGVTSTSENTANRRTIKVCAGERFDFSLPELTGCSSDFRVLGNEGWVTVTNENILSAIPTTDEIGPQVLSVACVREILVDETRVVTVTQDIEILPGIFKPETREVMYTITRPATKTSVHHIYLMVQDEQCNAVTEPIVVKK